MTIREIEVAGEILRLARELQLEVEVAPDEELAARLDSMALLALVVAVEDHFLIIIRDDDAAGVRSLADLARLVVARQEASRAEASP